MGALKDLYSRVFYNKLSAVLEKTIPSFDKQLFVNKIYSDGFEQMELKQRMRHTTVTLHDFMPSDYKKAVLLIEKTIAQLRKENFGEDGLVFIFIPDYIEVYGIDDFETSADAIEMVTQFVSCEFAVRPFLARYHQQMMDRMGIWSKHENHKVRRLSSEGIRPALPWAMAVTQLKASPEAILEILENMKNDPSEWVRKSVANNLNDISKKYPDHFLEKAIAWKNIGKETDAIIKHGARTLLKKGHPEILDYYGLNSNGIVFSDFNLLTPKVRTGENLTFSFGIQNDAEPRKIRLEYAIYYAMQNNKLSKKVFKISERIFGPEEKYTIVRHQKFTPITTRKFYSGTHYIAVIVNGSEQEKVAFDLLA